MRGLERELAVLAGMGAVCGGILVAAEALRRRGMRAEWTRKFVHVLMGLTALLFPNVFASSWSVAALSFVFLVLLAVSRHQGWLLSVHGVSRSSAGGVYYAIAVALLFFLAREWPPVYVASILVLTAADTMAAVVGGGWGRRLYRVGGGTKSLEGSLAFVATAFPCVLLPLLQMTALSAGRAAVAALLTAVVAAGCEAASPAGTDNVTVPVSTCAVLALLGSGVAHA